MVQGKKQLNSKPKFAEVVIGDNEAKEMRESAKRYNIVLTGDVAERFIEIADSSRNTATTVIPEGAQDAIRRMMERSKNVKIKLPL